jgi:hypothetical protein
MMKIMRDVLLVMCLAFFSIAAPAHPGHGDGRIVETDEVPVLGERVVTLLVQDKRLAPSWSGIPPKEVASRPTSSGPIWVVSYENPSEADKAKRTIYLFFDESGNYLGGNHSGQI